MKKKSPIFSDSINLKNRQAWFQYEIMDTFQAGLVLEGTEMKSIRMSRVSFVDGYCFFNRSELYVKGLHISPYKQASFRQHDPDRDKKLLLNKSELHKLEKRVNEKGLSIIPLRLFITKRGFAKLEIALGKGKKTHDKRDSIRDKDHRREINDMKL